MTESLEYGPQEEILVASSFTAAATAVYADSLDLVYRIRFGEAAAVEELAQLFSEAIRFYLVRNFGSHDLDARVHDTLVAVVQTIQRGEFREPSHLMSLIRTIARQQAAAHLERQSDDRSLARASHREENSTDATASRKKTELVRRVLSELAATDRELLRRVYLEEQSREQICSDLSATEAQCRLLLSRVKARFTELDRKELHDPAKAYMDSEITTPGLNLSRILPVVAHAVAVFGDEGKASHWFLTRLPLLHDHSPSEVLERADGPDLVDQILTRIEHNIPS